MKIGEQKIRTFLMFSGKAEEAMNFYISFFENSEILNIIKYGANESGTEGSVQSAIFTLAGQEFMCIDSNVEHGFTFTPAISLFVTCDNEEELNMLFEKLSQNGKIYMPLDNYFFSQKFGWVEDKYGVSWQLNLE